MIYRQLIEDLEKWSQRPNRKPLVLRGARQVVRPRLSMNLVNCNLSA